MKLSTWTMYDQDCLEELEWVVSKVIDPSVARKQRLVALVWSVCAFFASFLAFFHNGHPALVALFFVIGLLFALRVFNIYRTMAKRSWLGLDKSVVRNDYVLDKSHIVASNAKGSARYPYSQCAYLLETDRRCYVIQKEGQGLVLDKSHVSGGTARDMVLFLESHCGKKSEKLTYHHLPHLDSILPSPREEPPRLR